MTCTAECWTPMECTQCGGHIPPRGRSAPPEMYLDCCINRQNIADNKRHMWSEHDSDRHYFDPEGWKQHLATCEVCNEDA